MILILSDNVPPWLRYIWGQFVEINNLKSESILLTYSDYNESSLKDGKNLIIEYALEQRCPSSLLIPRKEIFKTDNYVWISPNLPIYRDTLIDGGVDYDIFYNAFVHLSRKEEWENEKKCRFIHSYSYNHPRKNKRIWKIPIVNYLFNELGRKIKERYPEVLFSDKAKPIVEFSHDVDYIKKTSQLRIKQSCLNFYNCGKFLLHWDFEKSLSKFKNGIDFALSDCDYWCFGKWAELEKQINIKAVYYLFAKLDGWRRFNVRKWLIEPSYDISKDKQLSNKCKELIDSDNRIGIHGSYFSAEDSEFFIREKQVLENSIGCVVTKGRQHWLNYYESKTPYIYDKSGIEEDSTLGFNDISGFRSGVASRYNPYDHKNDKPFTFKEIPLVIMDSHLYGYLDVFDPDYSEWLFDCIDRVKNFAISIDWHQRVISSDYGWSDSYRKIAGIAAKIRENKY